jgi:hypothetical protein
VLGLELGDLHLAEAVGLQLRQQLPDAPAAAGQMHQQPQQLGDLHLDETVGLQLRQQLPDAPAAAAAR